MSINKICFFTILFFTLYALGKRFDVPYSLYFTPGISYKALTEYNAFAVSETIYMITKYNIY